MRRLLARSAALTAMLVALVLVAAITVVVWQGELERADNEALLQASTVAAVAAADTDDDVLRHVIASTPAGAEGRLAVHLPNGATIGASRADTDDVQWTAARNTELDVEADGGTLHLRPVRTAEAETAVVEIHRPRSGPTGTALATIALVLLLAAAAVAGAVLLADRLTSSLRGAMDVLATTAAAIGRGDLKTRIRLSGPEELTTLAASVNTIGDRVQELLEREREMAADVSHQLRTPLTALRLDAEAGTGPVAERIRSAVATLEHGVDDIIRTARSTADHAAPDHDPDGCDIVELLRERLEFWGMLARDQKRSCGIDLPEAPLRIALTGSELTAVIDALFTNVFRYTPPGTPLAVALVAHAGWVTLVVEDGGTGIADPAAALRRGASGGGSTGLGLDIARSAVEGTGGTVHIERGRLGGARIRLRFAEAGAHPESEGPRAWRLRNNG
ncbi:sensor histidine kinase [Allosalinactinospora lopnorensis]|uniref:sensor histidine kinase n=1 Tax=Allosalinactinospora lopnorensis TaxID=1352348 RepID=UPI000623EA01|nr:HAMP domain-containing sensor histidine kinase [Allosalinactinospora lopnorensis]